MAGGVGGRGGQRLGEVDRSDDINEAADEEKENDRRERKFDHGLAPLAHRATQQGPLRGARHRTILPMMCRLCAPLRAASGSPGRSPSLELFLPWLSSRPSSS